MDDVRQPPHSSAMGEPTVRLEPVSESVIVPQPWYRKIFGPVMRTQTVWRLSVVAVLVVGVLIGREMQKPQTTVTQASVGKARVSLYPPESQIPPEKAFQLWMTTDQPVSSADITLTFDPKAMLLTREVTPAVIASGDLSFTTRVQANTTGVLEFHIKAKTITSPVGQGTMQLGTLYFNTTKDPSVVTANISINENKTVIINSDSVPFALSTTNATVILK
jgi:hypothetical protein